jgi:Prokaryotic N-terminal methylation motif
MTTAFRGGESGVTLVETMVAMLITTLVAAVFYTIFYQFSDDVLRQERRATTLEQVRPAVAGLIIELRQALDVDNDRAVVGTLDNDWDTLELVFYSDRFADSDGPERLRYYLENCASGLCELMRDVTAADSGSGPSWTYTGSVATSQIAENVLTDGVEPLFAGVSWRGGTLETTDQCGTSPSCEFEVLRIRLRVDPEPGEDLPVIEVYEDVRFRNATT